MKKLRYFSLVFSLVAAFFLGAAVAYSAPDYNGQGGNCPSGWVEKFEAQNDGDLDDVVLSAGTKFCVKGSNENSGILTADGVTTLFNYLGNGHNVSNYVVYEDPTETSPPATNTPTPETPTPTDTPEEIPDPTPTPTETPTDPPPPPPPPTRPPELPDTGVAPWETAPNSVWQLTEFGYPDNLYLTHNGSDTNGFGAELSTLNRWDTFEQYGRTFEVTGLLEVGADETWVLDYIENHDGPVFMTCLAYNVSTDKWTSRLFVLTVELAP